MTLTKADLIQQVYKNHEGLTKAQATASVEAFLRLSKESLIDGSDLLLSGFGKFNVKDKNSRRGRNPQTGQELTLDARRVVTFKPKYENVEGLAIDDAGTLYVGIRNPSHVPSYVLAIRPR